MNEIRRGCRRLLSNPPLTDACPTQRQHTYILPALVIRVTMYAYSYSTAAHSDASCTQGARTFVVQLRNSRNGKNEASASEILSHSDRRKSSSMYMMCIILRVLTRWYPNKKKWQVFEMGRRCRDQNKKEGREVAVIVMSESVETSQHAHHHLSQPLPILHQGMACHVCDGSRMQLRLSMWMWETLAEWREGKTYWR